MVSLRARGPARNAGRDLATIPSDVAYKRDMSFRALPVSALLAGVAPDETIRFVASDGFVATMPAAPLLARGNGAVAYVAIEPPDKPWPPLKQAESATAGPFYLVWRGRAGRHPRRAVALSDRAHRIGPAAGEALSHAGAGERPVGARSDPTRLRGDEKNCSVCHTLNLGGDATIGPDLNVPYNPTEYLRFMRFAV